LSSGRGGSGSALELREDYLCHSSDLMNLGVVSVVQEIIDCTGGTAEAIHLACLQGELVMRDETVHWISHNKDSFDGRTVPMEGEEGRCEKSERGLREDLCSLTGTSGRRA
jgi:hypothetical protein